MLLLANDVKRFDVGMFGPLDGRHFEWAQQATVRLPRETASWDEESVGGDVSERGS